MTKSINIQKKLVAFIAMFVMVVAVFVSNTVVFASSSSIQATKDEQAKRALTLEVSGNLRQEKYEVDGGGYLTGEELFEGDTTEGFTVNEDEFNKLTSAAQTRLVGDIAQESTNAIDTVDGVSESTVQNWWKELQSLDGVGSKFMNEILKNTKPDFVTANAIYQPFSGVVGTIMGLLAVLLMAFLGIVIVCDICYIALPPVRNFVADGDGGNGKIAKSKMFSYDAIYAVQCAEQNSDGGSGSGKQALGIYLKRRVIMLIILGICLLYLVQGQLYTAVGWLLDLVSGFLGF